MFVIDQAKAAISVMGLSFLPSLQSFSGDCELSHVIRDDYSRLNVTVDCQTIYTELRQDGDEEEFQSNPHIEPHEQHRLKNSSWHPVSAPYQFINQIAKDGTNGREAFFYDIFQSMNHFDKLIVKQLLVDDNNESQTNNDILQ